jgi:hypothetical protein
LTLKKFTLICSPSISLSGICVNFSSIASRATAVADFFHACHTSSIQQKLPFGKISPEARELLKE